METSEGDEWVDEIVQGVQIVQGVRMPRLPLSFYQAYIILVITSSEHKVNQKLAVLR